MRLNTRGVLVVGSILATFVRAPIAEAAKSPSRQPPPAIAYSLLDVQLFQMDSAHSSIELAVPWMGLAIASCEKAVSMNPASTRAIEMLRRLKSPPRG